MIMRLDVIKSPTVAIEATHGRLRCVQQKLQPHANALFRFAEDVQKRKITKRVFSQQQTTRTALGFQMPLRSPGESG